MEKELKKADLNKAIKDKKPIVSTRPGKTDVVKPNLGAATVQWEKYTDGWKLTAGSVSWMDFTDDPWKLTSNGKSPSLIRVSQINPTQLTALTKLGATVVDRKEITIPQDKMDQALEILKK